MFDPSKHQRVAHLDDPNRCQGMAGSNQCQYVKTPGSDYCDLHGGNAKAQENARQAQRMYMLAQWQSGVGQFSEHANVKSLREEIGILRMMIERKLLSCRTENDLLLKSNSISELVMKVTKCVESCDRIDARMGKMLDQQQILEIGNELITLISEFISDSDQLQTISKRMVGIVTKDRTSVSVN